VSREWDFGDSSANSTVQNPVHVYGSAGTYTVTLMVVDDDGKSDKIQDNVTIAQPTMHVEAIDMWYTKNGSSLYIYTEVTVHSWNNDPLAGVAVTVDLMHPNGSHSTLEGTTAADGAVVLLKIVHRNEKGKYAANVTNLFKSGYAYEIASEAFDISIPADETGVEITIIIALSAICAGIVGIVVIKKKSKRRI
jgi:hypothetical protein